MFANSTLDSCNSLSNCCVNCIYLILTFQTNWNRGVYPKWVGRESPTFLKVGVDGLVILGFDRLLLVVALGIPVMPTVNRDYLKLVLLYVYVNST